MMEPIYVRSLVSTEHVVAVPMSKIASAPS